MHNVSEFKNNHLNNRDFNLVVPSVSFVFLLYSITRCMGWGLTTFLTSYRHSSTVQASVIRQPHPAPGAGRRHRSTQPRRQDQLAQTVQDQQRYPTA